MKKIKIGMLGLGTVGSGVWRLLTGRSAMLQERTGCQFEIKRILVRDVGKKREVELPGGILTTRPEEVLNDPDISIVVELMGGLSPAGAYLLQALEGGKRVVTANKALLAERGQEILKLARKKGLPIGFEAAVAGGIPILKAIQEGFVGNRIQEIYGIVNGTSNYILSEMTERGSDFKEVLRQAQEKGYAESDPKMDIDGRDAAQKLAILVSLCTGTSPALEKIHIEGIEKITPFDIESAKNFGFCIKLLAICKQNGEGIEARVHPTFVPLPHPLADVGGVFNAIFLKGDAVGEAMFYGRGAGMMPTASAVVSDIVAVEKGVVPPGGAGTAKGVFIPMDDLTTEYYLRFSVVDRPGVLAQIAKCLGENDISISSVHQYQQAKGSRVPIIVMVHGAREKNINKAIEKIDNMESVLDKTALIRVERFS